jgi:hypothetical protein
MRDQATFIRCAQSVPFPEDNLNCAASVTMEAEGFRPLSIAVKVERHALLIKNLFSYILTPVILPRMNAEVFLVEFCND